MNMIDLIKLHPLIDELTGLINGYSRYIDYLDISEEPDRAILVAYKDRMTQKMDEIKEILP